MIGEAVGNFRIVSRLGRGGMGEVWLAEQKSIKTRVAIKMLRPDVSQNTIAVQRFFNEAVAVGQIRHAGILKIFDVGTTDAGRAYLVMEYLDGESLTARIARGPLPLRQVGDLGRQIASVLDATHSAGIVHRDLKPDNIFIVPDAELASKERVKVLDFGIAKLTANPGVTAANVSSVGTPHYMSPEQWHSLSDVDWRSDAYALGCVAFEMACGRVPFLAADLGEACAMHLMEAPPVPSSIVAGLPPAFDDLVARLLDKEPGPRPSMEEAMAVFAGLAEGRTVALRSAPAVAPRPTRAHTPSMVAALSQMWRSVPSHADPVDPHDRPIIASQSMFGAITTPQRPGRLAPPPSTMQPMHALGPDIGAARPDANDTSSPSRARAMPVLPPASGQVPSQTSGVHVPPPASGMHVPPPPSGMHAMPPSSGMHALPPDTSPSQARVMPVVPPATGHVPSRGSGMPVPPASGMHVPPPPSGVHAMPPSSGMHAPDVRETRRDVNDTSSPSQVRTMPARRGRGGVGIAILLVLLVGAAIGAVLVLRSRGDETATTPAGSNDKSAASRDGSTTMPSKAEAKPDAQAGSAPSAGSALAANPTKPKLKPKPAPKPHVAVPVPVPGQSNGFVRLDADVPCIVVVDDVPTSKVTPVDALALAPGAHRVRLVNDDYGIDYPIDVVVKPNAGEEIVVTFLEDGR